MEQTIQILFEDEGVCVIDKPPALVVNRAESVHEETLQDWAEKQSWFPKDLMVRSDATEFEQVFLQRSGIAHRLDKDTSGVMLIAKTPQALEELMRQFRERETEKSYLAVVHGKINVSQGTICLPLARSVHNRKSFDVDPEGRVSETQYKVLKTFSNPPRVVHPRDGRSYAGFTYVSVSPKTGRTHQIRVHMQHIHHPLVSDPLYVGRKRLLIDQQWCERVFLHAERIRFTNPNTSKREEIVSSLADDLAEVLETLQKAN